MNIETGILVALTYDQHLEMTVERLREIVMRGRIDSKASSTELIMAAFVTCDRQTWLPKCTMNSEELWTYLDKRQREAVMVYLDGANVGNQTLKNQYLTTKMQTMTDYDGL